MKKYKVLIRGENFLMRLDSIKQKLGFYTTRFVEASDEEEAEYAVMDLLRVELASGVLNQETDTPMMYAEEIEELRSFDGHPFPGTGLAFFPMQER
jgi:hypothetical protein